MGSIEPRAHDQRSAVEIELQDSSRRHILRLDQPRSQGTSSCLVDLNFPLWFPFLLKGSIDAGGSWCVRNVATGRRILVTGVVYHGPEAKDIVVV